MARIQQTLASQASFEKHGRKSKRELFLDQMNQVVPWSELLALVEPHYPKAGNGRQPVGLAIMLRTYFLQQWFGLSDPGMEEAFYESPVLRRFAGVDLGVAAAPDETTILRFRHLLEAARSVRRDADDGEPLSGKRRASASRTGTIVDATIIHAPTFDEELQRRARPGDASDQEGQPVVLRRQGAHRRGQQGDGGAFGVSPRRPAWRTNICCPTYCTARRRKVWGDGGYQGQTEAIRAAAPKAQDMTCRRTKYKNYVDEEAKRKNTTKARVRAKVEHPFRILKRVFGFTKVRYRGIWKNHQWLCAAFALVNLYQHRNRLAPQGA